MKTRLILCTLLITSLMSSCTATEKETEMKENKAPLIEQNDVLAGINLTVGESKRLIAKGIMQLPRVQERLKKGMIIITRGTTNTYIAEEMVHLTAPHGSFLTGHFTPEGVKKLNKDVKPTTEIVIVDGKVVEMDYKTALKEMKEGDIIFKGANLLNYASRQAAVCIGAPDGGTTFAFLPYVGKGKAEHIIAIGLEKETSANLNDYEKALGGNNRKLTFLPRLHVFKGSTIFTEIEALRQFADVKVFPYGAGGVAGREGGISLTVAGSEAEVNKILNLVSTLQGEKPFAG